MGGEVYGCQAPAMEDSICRRKQCSGRFSQGVEAQSSGACDSPPESPPFLLPAHSIPQRATLLIISPVALQKEDTRLRRASKAFFTIPFDTTSKTFKFISASFAPLLAARAGMAGLTLEVKCPHWRDESPHQKFKWPGALELNQNGDCS